MKVNGYFPVLAVIVATILKLLIGKYLIVEFNMKVSFKDMLISVLVTFKFRLFEKAVTIKLRMWHGQL